MEDLGKKLRKLRRVKNYTLREMGEALNMSFSILAMYERGERTPPVDKLLLLAEFFGVSTDFLLGKTEIRDYQNTAKSSNSSSGFIQSDGDLMEVPVLYSINNRKMEVSEEGSGRYRIMNRDSLDAGTYFYLKVKDDSMKGSRIRSGDLVLVKEDKEVENGTVALVSLVGDNRELIRRLYYRDNQVILQPDNGDYEPLVVDKKDIKIIGKVVRVEFDL